MSDTRTRSRGRRRTEEGPRARLSQLLPYLFEHKGVLVAVAVLSVIEAVATLGQPLVVGQVIERVQAGDTLGILVWALVILVVVSSAIGAFQHYLLQRTGTAVVFSSRRRLIARLLRLPISEFDARRTGDLVSRVGTDTTLLYAVLTQGLADSVGNALIFVGAIVAMLFIDPLLLLLIVVVIGASVAVVVALSTRIRRATREQQERVGELASGVERAIGSIRTIRAAGATEREEAAVAGSARDAYDAGVRVAQASALVVPVAGIALQLSLLVVLGVGGYRVAAGAISIASLVTFVMFLFFLVQPLASFLGAVTSVNQALGALGRIQEVLDLPTEDALDTDAAAAATDPGDADIAIEFRDVHFRYPEAVVAARRSASDEAQRTLADAGVDAAVDDPADVAADGEVLRGVSFRVPRGARVALVGPSGAGKSTTLALIERFYDVTGGAVLVGGSDIRSVPRGDLRAQLGYVEQDAPTLAGTIADNLRLASPEATDADCERVLRAVNLGEVLERSELGLEAPVGEAGVMLSGGERQRLAIARALLAAPPILLLDESTSSLDGLNEQRMREAIDAVATGRTLVVIAHRLSTVVDSDVIVVLDHGRVVGQGTHSELVATVPLYRDLAKHQLLV
ncbi:ABC transporter ATP-binding protein [Microbacterium imperiale]|uniref:ABC transporter n=1 Tax=Microbacterium imperiale TaxID=33884 RepID=A0A9W6M1W1_9MICO|nr:ABC transporter ATP-binding protein [Microbacterium imperiale]MBP2420309.1 ATP-binding cassette subfamily B protein [Microbacterium imperiale]MDS0197831.1 ABC transporter ATP-binding protein/permease [Microbacterium imperiale]BFE40651.1 ABC transporter ATP-binding protein [Microbacterium imperiale]GLJ78375.1 ABC transporter [Microbacterium imperiale]